jgi:pimeloyl-ACP methyl ester carboxylesterase
VPYLLPAHRIGLRIEGRGPAVVLLHSSMSSKSQWRELIESLRDRYRLIAIDLLGYGESAMPGGDSYSLEDEVSLVESVLAQELQAGERFHLIGHSYGGIVALQLAVESECLRSLSLFEPIAFHLFPDRDSDLAALETVRREIASLLSAGDAHGGAGCFVDYWSGTGAFARLRDTRQSVLAAQAPKVLLEYRAVADEARNAAAYRRIEAPTCLVAGRWSPEPAQRLMSMFADLMPHASCFEVAAGHMAPITHPALVNPIFEEFIRAVDDSEHRAAASEIPDHALVIPPFGEMTAVVRGQGWSRAIAVGLLGLAISLLPFAVYRAAAREEPGQPTHAVYPLEEDAWHEMPQGMPPGSRFAVISGDPHKAGPFVVRLRLPPGYILPPSRRRNEEQMIVLAGSITVGTGSESGATHARTLTAGAYLLLPANELQFAHTQDGAIVQIFGIGPFELI